jgi:hypothetical protein
MASQIPYGSYAREALLNVVRRVLQDSARDGIHPPHHFYITFHTDHPGVVIPDFLQKSYPDQMTIVLQHQFWDLCVGEREFSVVLSFNSTRVKLSISFDSLLSFSDPSVQFGLQFAPDFDSCGSQPPPSSEPPSGPKKCPDEKPDEKKGSGDGDSGNIVRLESFRKK